MKESCCLAKESEWEKAAEWQFKINNWANVNAKDDKVRDCFYRMDRNSPANLLKDQAHVGISAGAALLSALLLTVAN